MSSVQNFAMEQILTQEMCQQIHSVQEHSMDQETHVSEVDLKMSIFMID